MNKLDKYFAIYPYSYFGESTRDLGLTSDFKILCINPGHYIKDGTKIKVSRNEKSVICTLKKVNHARNRFKNHTITTLKSIGAWDKSKAPVFLCSDKVASFLGLDVDGDIALIQEGD